MPRKLVAKDHREAYHLWATHFSDPALLANRDVETTREKIARLAQRLPLKPSSCVLDVGPGDGALFRHIAGSVRRCCAVDPSDAAVSKLASLFRDARNVEFVVGSAEELPYPDDEFDVVVINSVLHILSSAENVDRSLGELVRVCRPGGFIFVGEMPFRSELDRGILVHLARKLREFGARAFVRNLWATYAKPLVRGEPLMIYPTLSLHFPEAEFHAMCSKHGAAVETLRHHELRQLSSTRNDYLLRLPPR
jgi:ubiquinone/menaquinone biosynthesis C-methylase UbiE